MLSYVCNKSRINLLIFSQLFKCLTVRRTLNSSSTTACSDIVVVCHFSAVIYFFSVDNDILLH